MSKTTASQIRKCLKDEGVVEVGGIWYFTISKMQCNHENDDGTFCCEDSFSNIDEAVEGVLYYAGDSHSIELELQLEKGE